MEAVKENIKPIALKNMARSIARSYGDKGAIIITHGEEGTRVGCWGLTDRETQEALCVGIHYNMKRICE